MKNDHFGCTDFRADPAAPRPILLLSAAELFLSLFPFFGLAGHSGSFHVVWQADVQLTDLDASSTVSALVREPLQAREPASAPCSPNSSDDHNAWINRRPER
ncbi:hypothetical protein [Tardiphaga sp. OK246]|jgi:hypothetical protein|uniref:hypothetical protein n=1 Tax=Tardiphaga sp. OK246 TaxID=1855307 RepID=UPI001130DA68|nr:hypothetical protein [Tardiphaga sp. OK246]